MRRADDIAGQGDKKRHYDVAAASATAPTMALRREAVPHILLATGNYDDRLINISAL